MSDYLDNQIRNRFFAGEDIVRITNYVQDIMRSDKKNVTKWEARHVVELALKEIKWDI